MSSGHDIIKQISAAQKNPELADEIIKKYMPFIKSETAKNMGRIPIEGQDDELSISMMAFHEAIEGYSRLKGSFLKFAALIIKRRLIDFNRREKKHSQNISIHSEVPGSDGATLEDVLQDTDNPHEALEDRDEMQNEIISFTGELAEYSLTIEDVAEASPKQTRTITVCGRILRFVDRNSHIIALLKRTKKLPVKAIAEGTPAEKKTVERHRNYIIALVIISAGEYNRMKLHLKQLFQSGEGGTEK